MTLHSSSAGNLAPRRSVFVAALVIFSAISATVQAGDQPRDNFAWVPNAEISPATTLLGRPVYVGDDYESARTWALHKIAVIQAAKGDVAGAKNTVAQIGCQGPMGEVVGVWFLNGQPIYDRPPAGYAGLPVQRFVPSPLRPTYNYDGSMVPGVCLQENQLIVPCGGPCGPCLPNPAIAPPAATAPAARPAPVKPAPVGEEIQPPPTPHPPAAQQPNPETSGDVARGSQNLVRRAPSPTHVSFKPSADLPANYLAADPTHGAVVDFSDDRDRCGTHVTFRKYADGFSIIETP